MPTSQEPLKLLVPLYVYPGAAWDTVAAGASKVGTIAIVNPNSGPAASPDSSYNSYMSKLKNAGVEMIGYVYTSYGARSIADVKVYSLTFTETLDFFEYLASPLSSLVCFLILFSFRKFAEGHRYLCLQVSLAHWYLL